MNTANKTLMPYEQPAAEMIQWQSEGIICESGYNDNYEPINPWA